MIHPSVRWPRCFLIVMVVHPWWESSLSKRREKNKHTCVYVTPTTVYMYIHAHIYRTSHVMAHGTQKRNDLLSKWYFHNDYGRVFKLRFHEMARVRFSKLLPLRFSTLAIIRAKTEHFWGLSTHKLRNFDIFGCLQRGGYTLKTNDTPSN
jgi:hypothetical protein